MLSGLSLQYAFFARKNGFKGNCLGALGDESARGGVLADGLGEAQGEGGLVEVLDVGEVVGVAHVDLG